MRSAILVALVGTIHALHMALGLPVEGLEQAFLVLAQEVR